MYFLAASDCSDVADISLFGTGFAANAFVDDRTSLLYSPVVESVLMKFGKRLLAEAARQWAPQYLDYKLLKRSLKTDCTDANAAGLCFNEV